MNIAGTKAILREYYWRHFYISVQLSDQWSAFSSFQKFKSAGINQIDF